MTREIKNRVVVSAPVKRQTDQSDAGPTKLGETK